MDPSQHPATSGGQRKARRDRTLIRLGMAAAAAAVVGAGVVAAVTLTGGNDPTPIPPAKTPTPTQSPTPQTSPTPTQSPQPIGEECSATELDADAHPREPHTDLPTAVVEMRARIVQAALRCDYDALNALALDGRDFFSYSFGDPNEEPGDYWRRIEEEKPRFRQPVLRLLVQTLDLSFCTDQFEDPDGEGTVTQYAWPAASCATPTDEQWAELEDLYSEEEIEDMKDFGSFILWRIGIYDDGDWTFYIAGD